MRKHDVRKWLHAILDLLPLFIIPVFMVYSHRHTIDTYSVNAEEDTIITNTYDVVNLCHGDFSSDSSYWNISTDNTYYIDDDELHFEGGNLTYYFEVNSDFGISISTDNVYYFRFYGTNSQYLIDDSVFINFILAGDGEDVFDFDIVHGYYTSGYQTYTQDDGYECYISFYGDVSQVDLVFRSIEFYDLTSIFGANIPNVSDFETFLGNTYHDYGVSYPYTVVSTGTTTVTYDNTDIGSQFIYALYNPIHDYFNFNNVGTFNTMYQWIEVNIFNGTAPLSVFIVWNIVLYEFIMDILFLFYAVFMFIVDFAENCIDRAFNKSCHGGR